MFEKEAEEYSNNLLKDVNCNIGNPRARQINSIDVENAYKDGAEFGYNKANEEFKICEQIEQLEKENAELKGIKDVATLIRANNDTVVTLMQLNNILVSKDKQLTKAKEIIKILLKYDRGQFFDDRRIYEKYMRTRGEAEQFLKESE